MSCFHEECVHREFSSKILEPHETTALLNILVKKKERKPGKFLVVLVLFSIFTAIISKKMLFYSCRYMFWTDWGAPKIEKCGMNGNDSTRQVIVERNLGWPNGLAIDYILNRLWWTDAKQNSIESVDLNGNHRRIVLKGGTLAHPFGISVFMDNMYWSDWQKSAAFKANKFTGKEEVTMMSGVHKAMDVKVIHREKQPRG